MFFSERPPVHLKKKRFVFQVPIEIEDSEKEGIISNSNDLFLGAKL